MEPPCKCFQSREHNQSNQGAVARRTAKNILKYEILRPAAIRLTSKHHRVPHRAGQYLRSRRAPVSPTRTPKQGILRAKNLVPPAQAGSRWTRPCSQHGLRLQRVYPSLTHSVNPSCLRSAIFHWAANLVNERRQPMDTIVRPTPTHLQSTPHDLRGRERHADCQRCFDCRW